MALPLQQPRMTRDAFIAWEGTQSEKHEFWQGEVFAMTGARQVHVVVALNVATLLKAHLRGSPCRAYMSDMQLEVAAADAVFYPDVFVSCDPVDLAADRTLSRPKLIVEVLSDSTAGFDRGAKFAAYRRLETLQEYVLVDPDRLTVEIFRRTESDDWLLATHDGERGLVLRSIDFEASLAEVFEGVSSSKSA
jgi:Uma2 family endonuclease